MLRYLTWHFCKKITVDVKGVLWFIIAFKKGKEKENAIKHSQRLSEEKWHKCITRVQQISACAEGSSSSLSL